ncbi:unnamed protein product [Mytilus edulis]|uniref:Uncharacterized protein n=1 Tax=Mytilus edulis TaxID=6550 RepID=A0A8S3STJ6_MYTED|nr:unnamed protein product [Mytilus edulis]
MVVYVDSEECTRKVTELKQSERKLRNDMVHLQNVFLERLSRTDKCNSEYKNNKAFVGFSAYMSEGFADSHSKSLSLGKPLIFDQTETNTAGVYNIHTDEDIGEFGTELVVDGKACGKLHVDTEHAADDACSTGFVIKYVRDGRTVHLKNIYTNQGRLLSKERQTRTTFSGWKLN